jgi:hypothetical protein
MIICLGRPSPAASSSLPAAQTVWVTPRRIFGLAPTGGYRATAVTSGAVGSYPTVSPLPCVATGRFVFCGPVRRLTAPRRYLAVYPVELGLSSSRLPDPRSPHPSCAPIIALTRPACSPRRDRPVPRDLRRNASRRRLCREVGERHLVESTPIRGARMSSSRKKVSAPARNSPGSRGNLDPRILDAGAAEQVKGGGAPSRSAPQASSKPVARYYLENAWPSK